MWREMNLQLSQNYLEVSIYLLIQRLIAAHAKEQWGQIQNFQKSEARIFIAMF